MTIAWGSALSKTHFDADTDDPSQARAELEAMVDRINTKLANQTLLQLSDKTGNDAGVVSGTAGTDGNLVQWNADGDVVDGPDVLSAVSSGSDTDVVSKGALQGAGVAALVPLAQATASGDATVDFTLSGEFANYDRFVVFYENVISSSDGDTFIFRISTDGGSSFLNSSNYDQAVLEVRSDTGVGGNSGEAVNRIELSAAPAGSDGGESLSGCMIVHKPDTSDLFPLFTFDTSYMNSGRHATRISGSARVRQTVDVEVIRFRFNSGNVSRGEFRLYGVKKS